MKRNTKAAILREPPSRSVPTVEDSMLPWIKPYIVNGLLRVGPNSAWLAGAPKIMPGELLLQGGLGFLKAFHNTLASWMSGRLAIIDGELVTADVVLNAETSYSFKSALISSLSFPTLDAASKEQARLSVSLSTSSITSRAASGKLSAPLGKQPLWSCSAFRVSISGLDMTRTVRVDKFTLTSASRAPIVNVTTSGNYSQLRDWHAQSIRGTPSARNMKITCLAPDHSTPLFSLDFGNVMPSALAVPPLVNVSGKDHLTRVTISLVTRGVSLA